MIRRPPRSTLSSSSAASDVYKRQDRGGPGIPERVRGDPARTLQRVPVVLVRQGRPAGVVFLLLPVGRRLRARAHQDLRLLPIPDQREWLNGHEWAKRQATAAGIERTTLPNGFATCQDPAALQVICDRLGPGTIQVFFGRWMAALPLPLTGHDQLAGYWWELSTRQVEISRTMVFDAPRRARAFFEALVAGNLDVGRPDSVELISTGHKGRRGRRPRSNRSTRQRSPAATPWSPRAPSPSTPASSSTSKTVARCGSRPSSTHPPTCAACAACRTSTQLQAKGRDVNARMLNTERVGQSRILASPAFERVAFPNAHRGQQEGPSLTVRRPSGHGPARRLVFRPQHRRVHPQEPSCPREPTARCALQHQPDELRPVPATHQRTHPAPRAHQHLRPDPRGPTSRGLLHQGPRPAPTIAADQPPAPAELRHALATIDRHVHALATIDRYVHTYTDHARLGN